MTPEGGIHYQTHQFGLSEKMSKEFDKIPQRNIQGFCKAFSNHLQQAVDADGGYIKKNDILTIAIGTIRLVRNFSFIYWRSNKIFQKIKL